MKHIIIMIWLIFVFTGCASLFTSYQEVVIDKHYVPTQCPKFENELVIPAKKYNHNNDLSKTYVIIELESLVLSLEKNKLARETYNQEVEKSNATIIELGTAKTSDAERLVEMVYVKRECPIYEYAPEINASKLIIGKQYNMDKVFVIVELDKLVFELEKNKTAREIFNKEIKLLNTTK